MIRSVFHCEARGHMDILSYSSWIAVAQNNRFQRARLSSTQGSAAPQTRFPTSAERAQPCLCCCLQVCTTKLLLVLCSVRLRAVKYMTSAIALGCFPVISSSRRLPNFRAVSTNFPSLLLHTMDQSQPEHHRSTSSGSISSSHLDWHSPLRGNESGEASSFVDFDFGDEILDGLSRNSIALSSMRRTSELLSPYDALEQVSDSGTTAPQPHDDEARDIPSQDAPVDNANKNSEEDSARAPRRKRFFQDWWFWEMIGALLSICCMVAVVILGLYLDGLSLSDWRFVMAPSTVISTLITVAKASILLPVSEGLSQLKWVYFWVQKRPLSELEAFDEASRGPWGSIMFFWKIKARSLLALCGAFLTVSALAMGPFAQQIISVEIRTIHRTGANASLLVTNMFVEKSYIVHSDLFTATRKQKYFDQTQTDCTLLLTCGRPRSRGTGCSIRWTVQARSLIRIHL